MNQADPFSEPFFIAYVYPGWHASAYRPGVNEWELLDRFEPYFDGHSPPCRPVAGAYDDSLRATADAQVRLAKSFGLNAFTYFLYWAASGFIMSEPMDQGFEAAAAQSDFLIAATWCIRLPVDHFPLRLEDKLESVSPKFPRAGGATSRRDLEQLPIEDCTLNDLERIIGAELLESVSVGTFRRSANLTSSADRRT